MSASCCTLHGIRIFGAMRPQQFVNAMLVRRTGQVRKRQFSPFGPQRLGHGPSDAVIVGHAHHQTDLAAEHAHENS